MKNNFFIKHFVIIGSGTILNMLLGLFTTHLITRLVTPAEYGQLSIFEMYSSIAVMVLCMGLDQSLVRYYYEHDGIEEKRALLFRCIKYPLIISVLASSLVMTLSMLKIVRFEFSNIVMGFLCIYTILEIIYRFSLLLIRLEYKSKLYTLLNTIKKVSYIVLVFPMLFRGSNHAVLILIISTILAALISLIVSIFMQAELWNVLKKNNKCHIKQKDLIMYAYPYILSMGITTLFQAIDKISLNIYQNYEQVGIYSSAITLVNIFAIIQSTFNTLWQPMAVEHFTNDSEDKKFYQKGNQIITVVMFFVGISLILFKDIFVVLLGEKYREAADILPFLVFNPIMYTISETTVNGLIFMKKSKLQVVVAVGACITNIVGNTILVPILGAKGAAISTGVSYIVFFTLRTIFSNRYFYVNYKLKKFYLITFIVIIYAYYNTFIKSNLGAIIGYIICLGLLFVLYKDVIAEGIEYFRTVIIKRGECK